MQKMCQQTPQALWGDPVRQELLQPVQVTKELTMTGLKIPTFSFAVLE